MNALLIMHTLISLAVVAKSKGLGPRGQPDRDSVSMV